MSAEVEAKEAKEAAEIEIAEVVELTWVDSHTEIQEFKGRAKALYITDNPTVLPMAHYLIDWRA